MVLLYILDASPLSHGNVVNIFPNLCLAYSLS